MKLDHIVRQSRSYVFVLLSAVLFVLLLQLAGIWPYLVALYDALIPIMIGIVIAFLLEHGISKLQVHTNRFLAVTLVYGIGILAVVSIMILVGPLLYTQLQVFLSYLPQILQYLEQFLSQDAIRPVSASTSWQSIMSQGYAIALSTIVSVSTTVNRLVFGYLAGYFISLDQSLFFHLFKRAHLKNEKQLIRFGKTCSNVMGRYLLGMSLDMLFLLVTFFIAFLLLQFPSPLLYATILSLLNMLPYIGPTIGTLIVVMVSMVTYQNPWLIVLIIWLIQQMESNYVQPFIFKKTMDLRPILTLTMMFITSAWLGFFGMVLAPILAAIVQIAYRSYIVSSKIETVGSWEEVWYNIDEIEIDDEEK